MTSSTQRNEIDVSWDPPPLEEQNGLITHYNVCYLAKGGTQAEQCVVVLPSLTSTTLTVGIFTSTMYLIRVAAATSVGLGPFSIDLQQPTLIDPPLFDSVPEVPVNVPTTTNIIFITLPTIPNHQGFRCVFILCVFH